MPMPSRYRTVTQRFYYLLTHSPNPGLCMKKALFAVLVGFATEDEFYNLRAREHLDREGEHAIDMIISHAT